jgi:hypothetical protein
MRRNPNSREVLIALVAWEGKFLHDPALIEARFSPEQNGSKALR